MNEKEKNEIISLITEMFQLPKETIKKNHIPDYEREFYAERTNIPLEKINIIFDELRADEIKKQKEIKENNKKHRIKKTSKIGKRGAQKPIEYYETHSMDRGNFKRTCFNRGWNFDDFVETFHKRVAYIAGRRRTFYFYKKITK